MGARLLLFLAGGAAAAAPPRLPERFWTRVTGRFEHGYNTDDDPGAPGLYMEANVLWVQDARNGTMRLDADTHERCGRDAHRWLHSAATRNGTTVDYDYATGSCATTEGGAVYGALGSVYRWAPAEWTLAPKCEDRTLPQTFLRDANVTERFLRDATAAYDDARPGDATVAAAVFGFRATPCDEAPNRAAHDVYVVDGAPRKETYTFHNGWDILTHVVSYAPFVTDVAYGDDLGALLRPPPECAPPVAW